jgi:uncharacterized membrane protein YdjX (TVP38/TMEM64 family)
MIINAIGFIPSVFITGANVLMWGPWLGGLYSWIGEVLGSSVAFILYRKGIYAVKVVRHQHWKWIQMINQSSAGGQALTLILARITPLIPSVIVNLLGAITSIPFSLFFLATAIGKLPSITLEVLISYDFIHIQQNYIRLGMTLIVCILIIFILKRKKTEEK